MTFEELDEALRAEGFYREEGVVPRFVRPLTGRIVIDSSRAGCRYACIPNGAKDPEFTWLRAHEALNMARAREV
jgi:hypothetical protein